MDHDPDCARDHLLHHFHRAPLVGTILPQWLYHIVDWPMNTGPNGGYNFWSGIGSGSPVLMAAALWWRHHNCHIHKCWRLQWHHNDEGHPVCRRHHPDHPKGIA